MAKRVFNLLQSINEPLDLWDRIYNWIVIRARIIILITEFFVVIAFFGKVVVDTVAKNMDKEIEKVNTQLAFYAQTKEPEIRDIQKRADNYLKLWNGSSGYSQVMRDIYSLLPNPNSEYTIRIDGDNIAIYGYENLEDLKKIEIGLKSSAAFSNVFVEALTLEEKEVLKGSGQYSLKAKINNIKRAPI